MPKAEVTMKFDDFTSAVQEYFTGRFQYIQWTIDQGHWTVQNLVWTFPTIGCITEFKRHFVVEFFGASERFRQISWHTKTKSKTLSANVYFQQFKDVRPGAFDFSARALTVSGMVISDVEDFKPGLRRLNLAFTPDSCTYFVYNGPAKRGSVFIRDNNTSVLMSDVVLINSRDRLVRAKVISLAVVVSKDIGLSGLNKDLQYINLTRGDDTSLIENRLYWSANVDLSYFTDLEFRSLYLTPAMRETTIGGYLQLKPEVLVAGISGKRFLHEQELQWQSEIKPPIKPDVLSERDDGYWDICDLKTAELLQRTLTTGGQHRRRFKEVIMEGVAQLAHYADYFKEPANAEYAEKQFGIRVKDPTLFLIVGERDNLPERELREASRMLDDRYRILDYDTVAELYAVQRVSATSTTA
jgi:hypothetical protein